GRARAAPRASLRRARARLQHLARAARVRPRPRARRGARGPGRVRRGRLPQRGGPLRRVRLGGDARARRPRALPRPRARDRPLDRGERARLPALHRPPQAPALQPLGRAAHLPGRLRADARRDRARARAARAGDRRRREPAPALRAHARALARALRGAPRRGEAALRRALRAHLAALPRGVDRVVPHRLAPALPGAARAPARRRAALDARGRLRGRRRGVAMDRCDVLVVGGGPGGSSCARALVRAGLDVVVLDRRTFPRDKVCAGWITPPVLAALDVDPAAYAEGGRVLQPVHGFAVSRLGDPAACVDYGRPVSYGIRRCELDHFLLARAGARLRLGEPLRALRRAAGRWIANDAVEAPILVGAGGHFCPVAQQLGCATGPPAPVVAAQEIEVRLAPDALE